MAEEMYKLTLDVHADVTGIVESELAKLGIGANVDVLYQLETITVPVTFVGTFDDIRDVAMKYGLEHKDYEAQTELL
jgi:hypothetical protein